MAGTGKTTIACTLAATLESRGQLAASFFCTRTSEQCQDANRIVPTIAYQLARHFTPVQSVLCQALEKDKNIASLDVPTQFERLLRAPLLEVYKQIPDNLVVVLDALDECSNANATQLILDMLLRFGDRLPLKFLVTSRPEPLIHHTILSPSQDSPPTLHLHEIEKSVVQSDIKLYLETELAFMCPPPSVAQIAQLAKLAGSLFIYSATAVKYI